MDKDEYEDKDKDEDEYEYEDKDDIDKYRWRGSWDGMVMAGTGCDRKAPSRKFKMSGVM
jgi:hypothetical protein